MKSYNRISVILSSFSFAIIAIAASIYPMSSEDFALTRFFNDEGIIERLSFSYSRSIYQFEHWNARLGEQIAIFILSMPGWFSIFVSVASMVALVLLINRIALNKSFSVESVFITLSIVVLLWPRFELFTWRTVVSGYTVPMIMSFYMVYLFTSSDRLIAIARSNKFIAITAVLSFLCGLSFENVPVALILLMICSLHFNSLLSSKASILPVSCLAGWLVLMNASSTSYRISVYNKMFNVESKNLEYYMQRAMDVITTFYETSFVLFIFSLIAVTFLYHHKRITKEVVILIISAVMVTGSVAASPYTEPRSFMFSWCVMLIVIVKSIDAIKIDSLRNKLSITICFMAFMTSLFLLRSVFDYSIMHANREHIITSQLNSNECRSGIKVFRPSDRYYDRFVNNTDGWYFNNLDKISAYYGCKIIK